VAHGKIFARMSDDAASLDEFDAVAKFLSAFVRLEIGKVRHPFLIGRGGRKLMRRA
jgi:hypothetical protein